MKYVCLSILALIFGAHGNQLNYLNAITPKKDSFHTTRQDSIDIKLDREKIKHITVTHKSKSLTINSDFEINWNGIRLKEVRIEEKKKRNLIFNGHEIRLKNFYIDRVPYFHETVNHNGYKQKTWTVSWVVEYEVIFKYGLLPFNHIKSIGHTDSKNFNVTKQWERNY